MNLQPVYAVKERLEHTILAGTNLLPGGLPGSAARRRSWHRSRRASPVFARIDAGVKRLLQAPAEARASLLLDTLALVDAGALHPGPLPVWMGKPPRCRWAAAVRSAAAQPAAAAADRAEHHRLRPV